MLQLAEMDDRVPLADQLPQEVGPVILINTFRVAPEDVDALLEAWAADAAYLKQQPASSPPSCTAASAAARCSSTTRSGSRWRHSGTRLVIRSSRRRSPATPTRRWPPRTCSRRWRCRASAWTGSFSTPGPVHCCEPKGVRPKHPTRITSGNTAPITNQAVAQHKRRLENLTGP
jgi:hypothetical protein